MTDTEPKPGSVRRWVWLAAGLVLLGISILPAALLYAQWSGNRELAAVRAELDAADPNWRMPDLFAARNAAVAKLPVNSAVTVAAVVAALPAGWDKTDPEDRWLTDGPPHRLPAAAEAGRLRAVHTRAAPALAAARTLSDQPDGGTPLVVPDFTAIVTSPVNPTTQEPRQVVQALAVEAALSAAGGDPTAALRSTHAALNAGRSIGDEPLLIAQLVRIACSNLAVRAAERALGLGDPAGGLPELQAAFTREADERPMRHGVRGELASVDQIMTNMRAGTASPGVAITGAGLNPFFPHDHAFALRLLRAAGEDCDRPPHRRTFPGPFAAEADARPFRTTLSRMLIPAVEKCLAADALHQARMLTAAVGLACERHRRATGRWPPTLAELPRELLPAVPADPFDGRPLRSNRTADGFVVYSVGPNRTDDGGDPSRDRDGQPVDVVFRLFDPAHRRLSALPPAAEPQP